MRCKSCDYSLWNLKARECPECGTGFVPSDFEFVPGAVRFCCPKCDQEYYGNGAKGHIAPRQFTCVTCASVVDLDEMILRPREGIEELQTLPGVMPWLERKKRGRIRAFVATVFGALFTPIRLMRGVPADAPTGDAMVFGGLLLVLTAATGGFIPYIGWWIYEYFYWLEDLSSINALVVIVLALVFAPLGILICWACSAHLMLRITGRCAHRFDRTIQALSYSIGANVLFGIPCAGPYFGWIWTLISSTLMLRTAQKVHGARAFLAVIAFPILLMLTAAGGAGATWFYALKYGPMSNQYFDEKTYPTQMLATQLIYETYENESDWAPAHAIELAIQGVHENYPDDSSDPFCDPNTNTTTDDIPVRHWTLTQFLEAPRPDRFRLASDLLAALPQGLIAHRFGDYIFVHHGADISSGDPNLWVVVMLPDPAANGLPQPSTPVHLASADYMVKAITFGELDAALKEQNEYRQVLELPALPPLETILHGNPAVGGIPATQPAEVEDPLDHAG